MSSEIIPMRWDPYVLARDNQFDEFWKDHLNQRERDLLFIVGRGFDFRAMETSSRIVAAGGAGRRDCWLVAFDNGLPDSELRIRLTNENVDACQKLFAAGKVNEIPVRLSTSAQQIATSRSVLRAIGKSEALRNYSDVVIDISAMPRMVAMTAVSKLIGLLDKLYENKGVEVNLHVTTSESVSSDRGATPASLSDSVTNVVGFSGRLNGEVDEHIPRVWFPVLGEDQAARLTLIREELRPDEICPVIPFPSRSARRGDEIVGEYRRILFDDFRVEPRNILHASEYNPFEAYRQLFKAIERYHDALHELGGCKTFVSPLSSKLLSIGALLACYDHRSRQLSRTDLHIGMPYVETATYGEPEQSPSDETELYSMWIRGEWER